MAQEQTRGGILIDVALGEFVDALLARWYQEKICVLESGGVPLQDPFFFGAILGGNKQFEAGFVDSEQIFAEFWPPWDRCFALVNVRSFTFPNL